MEFDVLDSLDDLGYPSAHQDDAGWQAIVEAGPKCVEFTQLVAWFSKELQVICGLDSCVNAIADPEDSSSFLLEVSSFLKEMQCPYKSLVDGPISQRLLDVKSRLILLDYLCTELQAARLVKHKTKKKNFLEIEMEESFTASSLDSAMVILKIDQDLNKQPEKLIPTIKEKVQEHISSHPDIISEAAVKDNLTQQQWDSLHDLYKEFFSEYTVRRELLLTRLDVTIQSFKWGEGSKGKESKILNAYVHKRKNLKKDPSVNISDVIAARESIFVIEKTSSAELVKNTKSSINRILIPAVPDRGGRPREQRPPVEMPNWMKRSQGGGGGRGDHRGGGNNYRGQGKKFKGPRDGGKKW